MSCSPYNQKKVSSPGGHSVALISRLSYPKNSCVFSSALNMHLDSQRPFSAEEFSCAMCQNVFKDPVLLTCSHNVCKVCFDQSWKCLGSLKCAVCREQTDVASPYNYVLKDLCEVVLQQRRNEKASACSTSLCGLHSEKFKLFCLEDQQLLCVACHTLKTHENRKCCTIDIAACDREVRKVKAITEMSFMLWKYKGLYFL